MLPFSKMKAVFLLILLIFSSSFIWIEDDPLQKLRQQLEEWNKKFPQDKIYVHTDRDYYSVKETLFFKLYQMEASSHLAHENGRVVYVNLVDESKHIISTNKIRIKSGFGEGQFVLADSLAGGTYRIVAYNSWMKNFTSDYYFSKDIEVVNFYKTPPYQSKKYLSLQKSTAREIQQQAAKSSISQTADIQFFPEGGNLVSGINSTVAFKSTDHLGRGTKVRGIVKDSNGKEVAFFESLHHGMGTFALNPEPSTFYKATIVFEDSSTKEALLPAAITEGVVMETTHVSPEVLRVNVKTNQTFSSALDGEGILVGTVRGKIYYANRVNYSSGTATQEIPKKYFPSGIVQLTLFNTQNLPECERLVFVDNRDALAVEVKTDKTSYSPREKVEVNIEVKDAQGSPVKGNISVSVVDENQNGRISGKENISTYLLLSSDLRGLIEEPGYYFSGDENAEDKLDLLMLTQGWRRFVWKEVLKTNTAKSLKYAREREIILSGKVLDMNNNPASGVSLILALPGASSSFDYTSSDFEGKFTFPEVTYSGQKELVISAIKQSDPMANFKIVVDQEALLADDLIGRSVLNENALRSYLKTAHLKARMAEDFTAEMEKELSESLEDKTSSDLNDFEASADDFVKLSEYVSFPTMKEVIQEIVPGFKFKKTTNSLEVRLLNEKTKLFYKANPLYFIDNVPVPSLQQILDLDPSVVENIVVIKDPATLQDFGPMANDGIFAVHTLEGSYFPRNIRNTLYVNFAGYNAGKEFYSPRYETSNRIKNSPDFRSLLHWEPNISTGKDGKASFSFFTSDALGTMRLELEGLSENGHPVKKIINIEVKLKQ